MPAVARTSWRNPSIAEWLSFGLQVLIAISFELADDIARGRFAQHGGAQGVRNAQHLVAFESAHGLFVEPAWQTFFLRTRHVLAVTVSRVDVAHVMNAIYVGGHLGVTLGVAAWVYVARRQWFAMLRNTVILTNVLALLIYERYPVAPPRLTTGLVWNGRPFRFQDTVFGVFDRSGHAIGSQPGFNEFSAMPSLHVAWALIAGFTLLLLARPAVVRAAGGIYPALMVLAVVVTGNHYLLDAAGAVGVVIPALALALAWQRFGPARLGVRRLLTRPATAGP